MQAKQGLIPACAGKTLKALRGRVHQWAHPRVCGENVVPRALAGVTAGSSPRVRGKPNGNRRVNNMGGLIPACAGKTISKGHNVLIAWAHPRVCGENEEFNDAIMSLGGSSPRVRGKRLRRWAGTQDRGLIPACAGKTLNDLEF